MQVFGDARGKRMLLVGSDLALTPMAGQASTWIFPQWQFERLVKPTGLFSCLLAARIVAASLSA